MTSAAVPVSAAWDQPDGVAARGTLVVIPGRGEHAGVYERFGRRLAADGYRVRAVADPTVDPERTGRQVRALLAAHPDADVGPHPRVLVGSDTGALFAARLAAERADGIAALVLAGFPAAGTRLTGTWDVELAARTDCPAHAARLTADPALRRGALAEPVPAGWLARAEPGRIAVPVLGLHGVDDAVAPLTAARDWYRRLPVGELVSVAGGRHDAVNDKTHRTASASVVLFLERLRAGGAEIAHHESPSREMIAR